MSPLALLAPAGALLAAGLVELAHRPAATSLRPADLAVRLAAHGLLFLLFFAMSWRPAFAGAATVVVAALVVAVSRLKYHHLHEPLVFSDFALIGQVIRYPGLYYAEAIARPSVLLLGAALPASIVPWYLFEPARLPAGGGGLAAAVLLPALLALGLAAGLTDRETGLLARLARRLAPEPDLCRDAARFGPLGCALVYLLRWRAADARRRLPSPRPIGPARAGNAPLIVVVQAESFVDIRRLGREGPKLACLDRLRRMALLHGRLSVPATGAYTMRSEFAVLSGLDAEALGFDRFDPFLAAAALGAQALPRRLARAGFTSVFIHPHDARFFRRDRAVPAFGFDRFLDLRSFAAAPRAGPHVADAALAEAILAEAGGQGPRFLYAVTMENHGPWGEGRLGETVDPLKQFAWHLANTDAMIGRLADALARRGTPTLLVVFGDHVPILPALAHPFPDTRTDYVVLEPGRDGGGSARDLSANGLNGVIVGWIEAQLRQGAPGRPVP